MFAEPKIDHNIPRRKRSRGGGAGMYSMNAIHGVSTEKRSKTMVKDMRNNYCIDDMAWVIAVFIFLVEGNNCIRIRKGDTKKSNELFKIWGAHKIDQAYKNLNFSSSAFHPSGLLILFYCAYLLVSFYLLFTPTPHLLCPSSLSSLLPLFLSLLIVDFFGPSSFIPF